MKGKQLAMDSALADLDRWELEREQRETDMIRDRLDEKYERIDYWKLRDLEYPAGSVVIIGQRLFRNNHYTRHFYRTVLIYWTNLSGTYPNRAYFVQANNEEWPDIPPWADTVGHVGELKDITWYPEHIHWETGEVVEPIETWWMKKWRENRMRTANLTWEDVMKQTGDGQKITVHYDGIQRSGFWYEDHMMEMFSGCELLRLTNTDYQVTKWPDRR